MKPHYFNQETADADDHLLGMAKMQGYVPKTCLLGGAVVMGSVNSSQSPCSLCNCDRNKCGGKPKSA